MPIPLVSESRHVTVREYALVLVHKTNGSQYGYPCGKTGALLIDPLRLSLSNTTREDYLKTFHGFVALSGDDGSLPYHTPYVEDRSHTYFQPAIRRCVCGEELEMRHPSGGYGIGCPECGREYSGDGYRLDPVQYIGDSDVPLYGDYE